MARVTAIEQAEHRLNVRRIGFDVRHHHDDIAWAQARIGVEGGEQLVVQDLDLTLRTMRAMEADRFVAGRIDQRPLLARLAQWTQIADVVLQLLQHGVRFALVEQIDALADADGLGEVAVARHVAVEFVEQADEIAALLAPGRKKRMCVQMQLIGREFGGRACLALLERVLCA